MKVRKKSTIPVSPIVHKHRTIAIELPSGANIAPLKVTEFASPDGSEKPLVYHWKFVLTQLDDIEGPKSTTVVGQIERVNLVEDFARTVETASKNERVELYAETGIWYDAIASLYELRRDKPHDLRLRLSWEQILGSIGLEDIAKKRVF